MNHDAYDPAYLRDILAEVKTIAMVGASPSGSRPSAAVMTFLQGKGYRVVPVNPRAAGTAIHGERCYANLAEVPVPIDMVDIFRAPAAAAGIVDEALALPQRPKVIWMQIGVRDDAAAAKAEAGGMRVVMNRCPKQEWARLDR